MNYQVAITHNMKIRKFKEEMLTFMCKLRSPWEEMVLYPIPYKRRGEW